LKVELPLVNKEKDGETDLSGLSSMAAALEASGRYRVLRKLEPHPSADSLSSVSTRNALFVDVETTGLDATRDEAIELAMVRFTYGAEGQIFSVGPAYQAFQQPSQPISPAITQLTGITDEMVAGKKFDREAIARFIADSDLVIAHNAGFDRPFAERISDVFKTKPWACSMSQVNWIDEGFEGTKLAYLATSAGFFYDRHRAESDCLAAIELLRLPLKRSGVPALARLLERARKATWRVWAENSPYELKDVLKTRGYRWNGEGDVRPKCWYTEVEDAQLQTELDFLAKEIYRGGIRPFVQKIDAYSRFSSTPP
jgi:DNA polymerase-3 subunit epsilon